MSFKDYLEAELKKPVHSYYDPGGNSARAVVIRGRFKEVIMQYRLYPERLREAFECFDGASTPVGLLIQIPIMIIFSPVLPIIAGMHWHRKSVREFMVEYSDSTKD